MELKISTPGANKWSSRLRIVGTESNHKKPGTAKIL